MCVELTDPFNMFKCAYAVFVVLIVYHINDMFALYGSNGLCRVNP